MVAGNKSSRHLSLVPGKLKRQVDHPHRFLEWAKIQEVFRHNITILGINLAQEEDWNLDRETNHQWVNHKTCSKSQENKYKLVYIRGYLWLTTCEHGWDIEFNLYSANLLQK